MDRATTSWQPHSAQNSVSRMRVAGAAAGARRNGRRGRASTMIEFAMILPLFLFMMLFTVDMGSIVLMSGAMQDATFSAARTGAQLGGASIDGTNPNAAGCVNGQVCRSGSTYRSLQRTVAQIPYYEQLNVGGTQMRIVSGAMCTRNSSADDHVVIESTFSTRLVTPGLNAMLAMARGEGDTSDGLWTLTTKAVARCEVTRR